MTDGDRFQDLDEPFAEDRRSGAPAEDDDSEVRAPDVEAPRAERPETAVPTPEAPTTRANELAELAGDVDPEFRALFWKLVLLYKLAVIGLTLGVALTVFTDHPTRGPLLLAGGGVLFLYTLELTRRGKARLDAGEFDLDSEGFDLDSEGFDLDSEVSDLDSEGFDLDSEGFDLDSEGSTLDSGDPTEESSR